MAVKRAKTLDDKQLQRLLNHIDQNSTLPERDRLIVALSFKAGLRVGEISKIDISAMTDAEGRIGTDVVIFSNVGKKNRERSIPMHPMVKEALANFRARHPTAEFVAISSQPFRWLLARGEPLPENPRYKRMSVTALTFYYWSLLKECGFEGASTHSGRRTFGTRLAQKANLHHCSIKDVQRYLGHARLETTEKYIEENEDGRALVFAI